MLPRNIFSKLHYQQRTLPPPSGVRTAAITAGDSGTGSSVPNTNANSSTMAEPLPVVNAAFKDVKNFLSVKSTDSRPDKRLSPLNRDYTRSSPSANGVLPPIKSQGSTSTSIPSAPAESSSTIRSNNEPLPSYGDLYGSSHLNSTESTGANGATPTITTGNPFITSQTRSQSTARRAVTTMDAFNQLESTAAHIKKNGIRTYPTLAVCSVFLCCPIFGMFASMLTLRAENSFYGKHYMRAHKEAFVARLCLLLAVVFGIITVISLLAYLYSP